VSKQLIIVNGQSQGEHNVLYVATEHDSLYAFDANSGVQYWKTSLLLSGESSVPSSDLNFTAIEPEVGITATPVIDRSAGPHGTIFVVAMSTNATNVLYRIHAIDLATGQNRLTPAIISASVSGTGPATTFVAKQQLNRAGLLLLNHIIYTCWASFDDNPPFSGWTHNSPIKIQLKDGKVLFVRSWATGFIFSEIFIDGVYDVLVDIPNQIIDIGANTGLFILRAKQLWPDASILAFEPEPNNYQALTETIRVNGLTNVEAINVAVADKEGSIKLFLHPRNIGGHSTVQRHSEASIVVKTYRLDKIINSLPYHKCDLLKVDCEGGELAIFQSLDSETAKSIGTIVYEPE
jgi:FkbM family methyltransferase